MLKSSIDPTDSSGKGRDLWSAPPETYNWQSSAPFVEGDSILPLVALRISADQPYSRDPAARSLNRLLWFNFASLGLAGAPFGRTTFAERVRPHTNFFVFGISSYCNISCRDPCSKEIRSCRPGIGKRYPASLREFYTGDVLSISFSISTISTYETFPKWRLFKAKLP